MGFPHSSVGKESAPNAEDLGLIPGLGRSPGEGKGYPLQYSALENSMDFIVQGVVKSWTRLSKLSLSLPMDGIQEVWGAGPGIWGYQDIGVGRSLKAFEAGGESPAIHDTGTEVWGVGKKWS